jgi:hypothetical protein
VGPEQNKFTLASFRILLTEDVTLWNRYSSHVANDFGPWCKKQAQKTPRCGGRNEAPAQWDWAATIAGVKQAGKLCHPMQFSGTSDHLNPNTAIKVGRVGAAFVVVRNGGSRRL